MSTFMVQPQLNCVLGVFKLTLRSAYCGIPLCCPGKQPRFESKPHQLAPYGIEAQVQGLMQKIDAIFVRYAYPPLPLGLMPFIGVGVYFGLQLSYSISSAWPDWLDQYLFWAIPVWFVIWIFTGKYLAYMKPRRIGQEIKDFNKSFNSTGISVDLDTHEATLTVKMNIPTRQRFCQSNGIQFHTPPTYNFDLWQSENRTNAYNSPNPLVQQFSGVSSVQVDQPPPYHTSNLDQLPKYEEAVAIRKY